MRIYQVILFVKNFIIKSKSKFLRLLTVPLRPINAHSIFMLQKIAVFVVLVLFTGVLCGHAQDTNAGETIKIDTRLVSVPVIVSDRNGRYVPNLTAGDFTVLQDGSPQTIEFFATTEEPLTIALLIDTSQSTRPVLDDIKDSAYSFVRLLNPLDRAMIVSFDYSTHILSPLTSDQEKLRKAIRSAQIPGELFGTTLREALYDTINDSFSGIKGRKAIILLTDGKDFGSLITAHDLLYKLQETDTLVYTVFFKTEDGPNRVGGLRFPRGGFPGERDVMRRRDRVERANQQAAEFLQNISDTTAGRFYSSKNGKLKKLFATIVEELKLQYRLGFYPPEETGGNSPHSIKVKVSTPDTVVRSRGSYRIQNKSN